MASYDPLKPVPPVLTNLLCADHCNCVFYMDLRKTSDYFPIQHLLTGFKKRDGEYSFRHCAVRWKVAVSIPDCVNGTFYLHDPFGHTMTLGSTRPLTEMSTRNISWKVKAAGARLTILPH